MRSRLLAGAGAATETGAKTAAEERLRKVRRFMQLAYLECPERVIMYLPAGRLFARTPRVRGAKPSTHERPVWDTRRTQLRASSECPPDRVVPEIADRPC